MVVKIGMELEGHFIDRDGTLSNRAEEVINHPKNNGNIIAELSKTMWEVIAPPTNDLNKAHETFNQELRRLQDISSELGLRAFPASSIHNESPIETRDYERPRGLRKRRILGNKLRDYEHHVAGTHIHVDQLKDPDKKFNQYLVMQAMDPAFTFMSSSPFFLGTNSKKDYRVEIYRNQVFKNMPLQGQLLDYPKSFEEAIERQKKAYLEFRSMLEKENLDTEGIDELNCIWGPLRITKYNTIESRCADANKLSNVIALASLYQGISEFIEQQNPTIKIDFHDEYAPKELFNHLNGTLILPSYTRLKNFEKIGIKKGLENNALHDYLGNVLETSKKGLEDPNYLKPFEKILKTRKSFSDEIVTYALSNKLESNSRVNGKGAKKLRQYIAKTYEEDLN